MGSGAEIRPPKVSFFAPLLLEARFSLFFSSGNIWWSLISPPFLLLPSLGQSKGYEGIEFGVVRVVLHDGGAKRASLAKGRGAIWMAFGPFLPR